MYAVVGCVAAAGRVGAAVLVGVVVGATAGLGVSRGVGVDPLPAVVDGLAAFGLALGTTVLPGLTAELAEAAELVPVPELSGVDVPGAAVPDTTSDASAAGG